MKPRLGVWLQENQDCNKRASFLAERVVQGDALLAKIRIRPNEWGYATVKWGSFDLALCEVSPVFLTFMEFKQLR